MFEAQTDAGAPRPAASLVIPTRDRARSLPGSIETVKAQDYPELEIIYVDDGSGDSTPAVLEDARSDERIRTVRTEGIGPGPARNAGVRASRGGLLLFTDDDVALPPTWVNDMIEALERSRCDALCGAVDTMGRERVSERYMHHRLSAYFGKRPRRIAAATMMSFIIARPTFDAAGGFMNEPAQAAEDWEFCQRLREKGFTLYFDPAVRAQHRYPALVKDVARRMAATGALGVYVRMKHGRSLSPYVAYSALRFLACPAWIPRKYPAGLWPLAAYMEARLIASRLWAYGRVLRGLGIPLNGY